MRRSKLEKIDGSLFRSLALEEQARAIGGGVTYAHTITVTNSPGVLDAVSDVKMVDVTPDQPAS